MELSDVDLLDPDRFVSLDHHEMFKLLRKEAPVHWTDEGNGKGFWSITKLDDLREVNRDPMLFSSQEMGISLVDPEDHPESADMRGVMMLYTDPPEHTRYRRLVSKGFTPRMIGLIEQYLEHRAERIVDAIIEKGECDFVVDLASELPLQAIAEIMGVPQEDRMLLFEWSNALIGIDDPEYAGDPDAGANAAAQLYAYSNELAKERREDPRDDIVTKLINANIDGDTLSELEFDMFMLLLTVAGNETTRNATAHGMLAFLENPAQWERLKADPKGLMASAVDEIVRWATPVLHFRRTAMKDTVIRGQKIAKGDKVVMWHISANRDEDAFEDPFKFDIGREDNDHIAFGGGGAHFCLGANLAKAEIRIIFSEILRRMPEIQQAGPAQRLRSNFIGGIKHLPITYTPGPRLHPVDE